MLTFLILGFRLGGVFALCYDLEIAYLAVETGKILLDDECKFIYLDGPVVEDGFLACDYMGQ